MKQKNYLAQWSQGYESDETVGNLESTQALELYKKILKSTESIKIDLPTSLEWDIFSKKIHRKVSVKKLNLRLIWSMAASLILFFGLNYYLTAYKTVNSDGIVKQIELPDGSLAKLNPGSSIKFRRTFNWFNRNVKMKGDVSFIVKKGNPFNVYSTVGKVEVLGTTFRVLSFENYFGVICKEGSVSVTHENNKISLTAGKGYNSITKTVTKKVGGYFDNNDRLYYQSTPLTYIVFVIEKVYGISVELITSKPYYFTGVLPIKNKEEVFKILSETFSLKVRVNDDTHFQIIESN